MSKRKKIIIVIGSIIVALLACCIAIDLFVPDPKPEPPKKAVEKPKAEPKKDEDSTGGYTAAQAADDYMRLSAAEFLMKVPGDLNIEKVGEIKMRTEEQNGKTVEIISGSVLHKDASGKMISTSFAFTQDPEEEEILVGVFGDQVIVSGE